MDWIYVAQDTVQLQAFVNTTINLTVSWCQVSNTALQCAPTLTSIQDLFQPNS